MKSYCVSVAAGQTQTAERAAAAVAAASAAVNYGFFIHRRINCVVVNV